MLYPCMILAIGRLTTPWLIVACIVVTHEAYRDTQRIHTHNVSTHTQHIHAQHLTEITITMSTSE